MHNLTRIVTGIAVAAVLAVGTMSVAQAADENEIPEDVAAAYSSAGINYLRGIESSMVTVDKDSVPDFESASLFGDPRQIYLWSPELIAGRAEANAVAPLEEWLAPILGADGDLVGTYRVWRQTPESKAEYAGYNDDKELARALDDLDDRATLVSDPTIDAWYSLQDGRVTALNESAAREVPYPSSIDEVRGVVSARYAEAIEGSREVGEGAAGGMSVLDRRPWFYGMNPVVLGIGAMLLIVSAAGAVMWVTARRRTT